METTMKLTSLLNRGLWPFTPDPIPVGLHILGSPAPDLPVLITGNSRHGLKRVRRVLTPIGARVLVVDTGGLDLHSACAAGSLTLKRIEESIRGLTSDAEQAPVAEDVPQTQALLPYPVWKALGGEEIGEVAGWRIGPGPADVRDLPAYLARGHELTEGMKVLRFPLADRLQLALAHAGLFALVAAIPMLFFGPEVLAAGIALILLSTFLFAVLWPWLPGRHRWQRQISLLLGMGLLAASLGLSLNLQPVSVLGLTIGVLGIAGWATFAFSSTAQTG